MDHQRYKWQRDSTPSNPLTAAAALLAAASVLRDPQPTPLRVARVPNQIQAPTVFGKWLVGTVLDDLGEIPDGLRGRQPADTSKQPVSWEDLAPGGG
ncbi:MAG: hypothetical protein QOK20_3592 [Acidimicrobiaceae bacterium]|nr:hypothetical protein [Acidimicrobiaceae bacterium]